MAPAKAAPGARPLSPHLQIYRWTWTMAMSVVHRVTGIALYGGTVLVAYWLYAMGSGPAGYETASWLFGSILGRLVLFGYTLILMHHMLGGIRHLVWDFGHGYEAGARLNMARFTLIGSVSLTVLIWAVALFMR